MNWLTDNKIPIDDAAEAVFDWLLINAGWLFDGLAVAMEWLIDAILWVLQTPHPLIVIAVFGALTWAIQRNWKTQLLIVLGFLFILNQDYWEETTESLTLVLSACVVCMDVGVPIGIEEHVAMCGCRCGFAIIDDLDLSAIPTLDQHEAAADVAGSRPYDG